MDNIISLKNKNNNSDIFFKVMSNFPDKILAVPNSGIIKPNELIEVKIKYFID